LRTPGEADLQVLIGSVVATLPKGKHERLAIGIQIALCEIKAGIALLQQ
jgi:hypothetical protein